MPCGAGRGVGLGVIEGKGRGHGQGGYSGRVGKSVHVLWLNGNGMALSYYCQSVPRPYIGNRAGAAAAADAAATLRALHCRRNPHAPKRSSPFSSDLTSRLVSVMRMRWISGTSPSTPVLSAYLPAMAAALLRICCCCATQKDAVESAAGLQSAARRWTARRRGLGPGPGLGLAGGLLL